MNEAIIIDNGTNTCKAGFSDDDMPTVEIPTVIGYPSDQDEGGQDQTDVFVGEEALSKVGILKNYKPIQMGEFRDLKKMEEIWKHIFYNELLAETKTHPVIMTEAPFSDYANRAHMAQVLFEDLNVDNLYIANTSTLALYANGKTTGVVVDIGYQTTSCVPIYEGFVLNHAVSKVEIGGYDLTEYLCELINGNKDNNIQFVNTAQKEMINYVKENKCEVTDDFDSQMKKYLDQNKSETVQLPDGITLVKIGGEKYQCPEMLFQPLMYKKNYSSHSQEQPSGIHEQAFKAIKKCDDDIQKDLFLNAVLCGGSSLFMKIKSRFNKELQSLAPTGKTVKVIAPPERKYSAWLGGAILASLDNFKLSMYINKKEYGEYGSSIVYKKFF